MGTSCLRAGPRGPEGTAAEGGAEDRNRATGKSDFVSVSKHSTFGFKPLRNERGKEEKPNAV